LTLHHTVKDSLESPLRVPAISGALFLALATIGLLLFFWSGVASLLVAWTRPEYSYGYLIFPLAAYIFLIQLRREDEGLRRVPTRHTLGIAAVCLSLAIGLLGNLTNLADLTAYGFVVCIAGLVLIILGDKRGLRFWAPVVYLIFMLPLPSFLYWPLSFKLQTVSSELGVAIVSLFGVPVLLDGNIIDFGTYKLQVAEACSGLRYLFPLMSFGFLFAFLYKGPAWHKLVLFLSTVPITILMNSVRIGATGLLASRYGIQQAQGFLHYFEGWVVFLACIILLYAEAILLQRLSSNPRPAHAMLDIDLVSPLVSPAKLFLRIRELPVSRALIFTSVVISLAGLVWQLAPQRAPIQPQRTPLALFPLEIGGWRGHRQTLEKNVEKILAADDYLLMNYSRSDGTEPVNFFIAYFKKGLSGVHNPEQCLPGGGWELSNWTTSTLSTLRTPSGALLAVNRATMRNDASRGLVYFWYNAHGRSFTNGYLTKLYTLVDSVTRRRADGALVRVITPISDGETEEAASERLRQFLEVALPEIPKYVPR
jgi:exosortase D (VPLPA-CTERM-specific)